KKLQTCDLLESSMSTIESVLHESRIFPPAEDFVQQANVSGMASYQALCHQAQADYQSFWAQQARTHLVWHKPFTQILDDSDAQFFKWFGEGELNISYNCLDRHVKTQPDKVAIIFESDAGEATHVTYRDLHQRVCKLANALKAQNIQKGDCVIIY